MGVIQKLNKNISNLPGWKTKRKIVVFESDDWGSIRMSSRNSFEKLINFGFQFEKCHYSRYDALESNEDLEMLFDLLVKHKDKNNRSPVFTALNIVGNPDFLKIEQSNFANYYFEPFTETLNRYPCHHKVYDLYHYGIKNNLFIPYFHGREHINVQRWMNALNKKNQSILIPFKESVTGIRSGLNGESLPNFQAAFDIDKPSDINFLKIILNDGLSLFKKLFGYSSKYFVPTNGPFNNNLEKNLFDNGVKYLNTAKKQIEPLGNNQFKTNIRFLGNENKLGQIYLTRNCFFEPSSLEHRQDKNWVDDCLQDIEIAFRWNKPAIVSTHRVNYIGFIDPDNRKRGLKKLDLLLNKIIQKWPDIEFMTSVELGDLIVSSKYHEQ